MAVESGLREMRVTIAIVIGVSVVIGVLLNSLFSWVLW